MCVTGRVPSVSNVLNRFCTRTLWKIVVLSFVLPLFPLSESHYLGIGFSWLVFVLAPLLLTIATGLVSVIYGVLVIIRWILRRPFKVISRSAVILFQMVMYTQMIPFALVEMNPR
jgi:hypothetical protein